jgi:C4-dicarboxylate transporter DctQ subunit
MEESLIKKIPRYLLAAEESLIWVVTLQIALLTFVQVVLRYVFNSALSWGEELLRVEVVVVTFMGAALGVKYGAHIGVDVIRKSSPPGVEMILALGGHLLTGAFCSVLFYLSIVTMLKVGSSGQLTPALMIPKYLLYIPMSLGTLIIVFRSVFQIRDLLLKRPSASESEDSSP